tara:strand:- start:40120 stop:41244 length:1125 start_codon:yes stop_codon:yes gene_type:complete
MKTILITVVGIITLLFVIKPFKETKSNQYTVIKKIGNIEIREYKKLIYVSYIPKNIKDRDNSFRNVAEYIFGGNKTEEKIAMTSPVVIKLHNKNEMAFIMPDEYTLQNLPKAKNSKLLMYEEPSNLKASIAYSGYSNKEKEKNYINKLKKELEKYNIEHNGDFEVLIYNSPYKFLNRKNEIVVSIKNKNNKMIQLKNDNVKTIHLGGGCFWCTEAIFEDVIGVVSVKSGFAGGKIKNPSYREVTKGTTEHAEVCEIQYDTKQIKLENIMKIFFLSHDPTTLNRQGNDIGTHYRSIVLYNNEKERKIIIKYMDKINKEIFDNKIVTEVKQFNTFYEAEAYHQNYYKENSSAAYCSAVITPKVLKAKKELSTFYKK